MTNGKIEIGQERKVFAEKGDEGMQMGRNQGQGKDGRWEDICGSQEGTKRLEVHIDEKDGCRGVMGVDRVNRYGR